MPPTTKSGPSLDTIVQIALTVAFSCVGHATALFPPGMPLTGLWAIYRRLVPL